MKFGEDMEEESVAASVRGKRKIKQKTDTADLSMVSGASKVSKT
jgi:hypothetical protein